MRHVKKSKAPVVHEVTLTYKCGAKLCHYGYRKWCRFLAFTRFGSTPVCTLLNMNLDDKLTRLTECLSMEKEQS